MAEPLYEVVEVEAGKVTRARWRCPHCGLRGPRRRPIYRHMNGVAGVRGPSCPELLREERVRKELTAR